MSTIIATTLSDGSVSVPTATVVNGSAKAWVNFNGTGTIAIKDSLNTSGLIDQGTGNYTQSFSTSFSAANYTMAHGGSYTSGNGFIHSYTNKAASSIQAFFITTNAVFEDTPDVSYVEHGDLA